MRLSKMDKLVYVGAPWFFGVILTVLGIYVSKIAPEKLHGIIMICTGLVCVSLYCVCALLSKIAEKDN